MNKQEALWLLLLMIYQGMILYLAKSLTGSPSTQIEVYMRVICTWLLSTGTLGQDLGFLTLATTGTPTTALPNMQDDYSESISNVPGGGIPYLGNMSSTMVYVSLI